MKVVFCGTPQFAVPTLESLVSAGHEIALVVTQPDRPQGRGLELAASPVKQTALRHSLSITQPERIKNNTEFRQRLEEIAPEVIVVVGYGRIIPPWMLGLPRLGNINLHASLLPKYRGAAPIQWAIAEGETITGVTTMLLNEGLDTGDILLQREMPIALDDTAVTLAPRLATVGAALMLETLQGLQAGSITAIPQDHSCATLAPILKREDGLIDFSRPAEAIVNRLRGFQPWPGAYTFFRGKKLAVLEAKAAEGSKPNPGTINVEAGHVRVGCGNRTTLELVSIQLEGKKRTSTEEFVRGYRVQSGEELGQIATKEASS
jgi:methionyl-tRNA formyltransferase